MRGALAAPELDAAVLPFAAVVLLLFESLLSSTALVFVADALVAGAFVDAALADEVYPAID